MVLGEFIGDASLHARKTGRIQSLRGGCLKLARLAIAALIYAAILLAMWFGLRHSPNLAAANVDLPRAFASFALLLAPLWFFGFGAAEPLKRLSSAAKIATALLSVLPYLVFSLGTPDLSWQIAFIVAGFPVLLAAFLELPNLPAKMKWRDVAVLAIVAATYFSGWFQRAWPHPALAVLPKLFLADVVLYCFLVIRKLEGAGFSLVPTRTALVTGIREWAVYFPFALVIGELTGFIRFHAVLPSPAKVLSAILVTFLLIALPEELFFRAVLQNLIESRASRTAALLLASILFGLSHFNHGASFNWRYVLLATSAGIFYGRAWREHRQIFAALVTHTAVDVVWSLWFR